MSKANLGSFVDLLELDFSVILWLASEEQKYRQTKLDELERLMWQLR